MVDNSAATSEFESLWLKATNKQKDYKPVEVEGIDTDKQIMVLLPELSRLADSLNSSEIIDSQQYDQMVTAIANLREVIKTIDHEVLSEVLTSLA